MPEYVERGALLKKIEEEIENYDFDTGDVLSGIWIAEDVAAKFPTADVAPVRHGRWSQTTVVSKRAGYGVRYYFHAECEVNPCRLFENMNDYCPNCGAKMDLECASE